MGVLALIFVLAAATAAPAQEDVSDIPSVEVKIGGDATKRYFRLGPGSKAKAPPRGYGLLVILPGGPGTAAFNPFCRRLYKHACKNGWVAAELVAVKWTPTQRIVWPTETHRVTKQEFSTEAFVEDVVADVRRWKKIDPARIFVLAWSSSGPAAYEISLGKKKSPTGFFIAMSVFTSRKLEEARGEAYYLYHSPADRTCAFRFAKAAEKRLREHGARVKLVTYEGGHGWSGNVYGAVRDGLAWLETNHALPARGKRRP